MPKINQDLLARLRSTLGVSTARVYKRIEQIANRDMLDRDLAALVLAAENGINIQKYSTPEQRAQVRAARGGAAAPSPSLSAEVPDRPPPRKTGSKKARALRPRTRDNSVFVVHGRNEALRKSMFDFLRALGLNPMEWSKAVLAAKGANPHVDDVLDTAMARVQAVVVLFSPDDEARLRQQFCSKGERATEGRLQGQPRPNVIFEAGMALGRHPEKTLLVQVGKLRGLSDLAGKHIVRLSNEIERRNDVANRLRKLHCPVDTSGSDWTNAGDFTA
jgi:predicted nucleotide-binding protein